MDLSENRHLDISVLIDQITQARTRKGSRSRITRSQIERPGQFLVETGNDNIQFVIRTDDRLELVFQFETADKAASVMTIPVRSIFFISIWRIVLIKYSACKIKHFI